VNPCNIGPSIGVFFLTNIASLWSNKVHKNTFLSIGVFYCYEWAKRTKFLLLAVLYGSPRRHSNSNKNLWKQLKYSFMTILGPAESFKTMSRPNPTVTLFDSLFIAKYKRLGRKILRRSLFISSICAIKILDRYRYFGNWALFSNVAISVIFSS